MLLYLQCVVVADIVDDAHSTVDDADAIDNSVTDFKKYMVTVVFIVQQGC